MFFLFSLPVQTWDQHSESGTCLMLILLRKQTGVGEWVRVLGSILGSNDWVGTGEKEEEAWDGGWDKGSYCLQVHLWGEWLSRSW